MKYTWFNENGQIRIVIYVVLLFFPFKSCGMQCQNDFHEIIGKFMKDYLTRLISIAYYNYISESLIIDLKITTIYHN